MAGFNRFEQYGSPTPWNLPKTDLSILGNVLQAKQQRFDAGFDYADKLSQYVVDSLPQDRARANAIQQEWETKKEELINKYNGDYASAYRDLRGLGSTIEKQMRSGGEANAIIANKKAFTDWYTAASKDKEVNPETLNAASNYYMNEGSKGYYSGVGEKDPITGNYNIFNPEQIMPTVNPDTIVLPAIEKLKANGFEEEYDQIAGAWKLRNKVSGEEVSYDRIYNTALQSLQLDPKYLPGLAQELRFKGVDDLDPNAQADALARNYADNFSYRRTKTSQTMDANSIWMHNDREARKEARHKEILGDINRLQYSKGTLDYNAVGIGGKQLTESDIIGGGVDGINTPFGRITGSIGGLGIESIPALNKGDFIVNQLRTGEFAKKGFDGDVMATVIKNNPSLDMKGTIAEYNKAISEIGAAKQVAMIKLDPETAKELTGSLMQNRDYRNSLMWVIDGPNSKARPVTGDKKDKELTDLFATDNNGKPVYIGPELQNMIDNSSGIPASFQIPLGKGKSIFIQAPDSYTRQFEDVVELSNARENPNGIAEAPNGLNFDYSYITVGRDNKPMQVTIPTDVPVRNKSRSIATPKRGGGYSYRKEDGMEKWNASTKTWEPITYSGFDNNGEYRTYSITPNDVETSRKQVALPQYLGTFTAGATMDKLKVLGNTYNADSIYGEEQ